MKNRSEQPQYCVLVKVCRTQTHRAAQRVRLGSPLNMVLSSYITESLTVDHSAISG